MSGAPTGFALIRAAYDVEGLDEHERGVLVLLAFMANEDGEAWPSIGYIVEKTGQSERTIQRAVGRLVEAGHLTRRQRRHETALYRVHPQGGKCKPVTVTGVPVTPVRLTPVTDAVKTRQSDTLITKNNHGIIDATASIGEEPEKDPSEETAKPEHFVEVWNDLATRLGKPTIRTLTPERRQKLKARMAEYPIADFQTVLSNIEKSTFLRDGRFLTFDWIIGKANFLKVLEGNYNR